MEYAEREGRVPGELWAADRRVEMERRARTKRSEARNWESEWSRAGEKEGESEKGEAACRWDGCDGCFGGGMKGICGLER